MPQRPSGADLLHGPLGPSWDSFLVVFSQLLHAWLAVLPLVFALATSGLFDLPFFVLFDTHEGHAKDLADE